MACPFVVLDIIQIEATRRRFSAPTQSSGLSPLQATAALGADLQAVSRVNSSVSRESHL